MAFDLTTLPAFYVERYGKDKCCELVGQTSAIVGTWMARGNWPLTAVQALLTFDPAPLAEIKPLYPTTEIGAKLVILVPLSGPPAPKMMDCIIKLIDKREMDYRRYAFNCLSISRNVLAAEFLRGPWTWAWWQDADNIVPCGDGKWFREAADLPQMPDAFANLHSIHRALVHGKKIVSACYIAKRRGGPPQFAGGDTPAMRDMVKLGPRDRLIEVGWSGMGAMLTHRDVFTDIIKTQGDEIKMKPGGIGDRFGYSHAFFHPTDIESPSDDIPFARRAGIAGHKIYVDLAIQSAHVGDRAFSWQDL